MPRPTTDTSPDAITAPAEPAAASIRRRLIVSLLAGTALLSAAGATAMYVHLRGEIVEQYDLALRTKARALASLVEVRADGGLDFEFAERAMPEYRLGADDPDYFQIWQEDGSVFARSPSLASADLPKGAPAPGRKSSAFYTTVLPGGRPGYGVWLRFRPSPSWEERRPAAATVVPAGRPDESVATTTGPAEMPNAGATSGAPPTPAADERPRTPARRPLLYLSLASVKTELDETLSHLLMSLVAVAGAVSGTTVLLVIGAVRAGLRPLRAVADAASRVTAEKLDYRFPTAGMPAELLPICQRLNELLAKLDEAFGRERRFTSNVAHELRTPISELRSVAEVALRWPGDEASTARNFQHALSVARQMESTVTTLLALVRCEAGRQPLDLTTLDVDTLVADAWRPHAEAAAARGLAADFSIPAGMRVETDRTLLAGLMGNLFSNAVAYAPPGGQVAFRAEERPAGGPAGRGVRLTLTNANADLIPEDLPHVAEPFWRKDAARSDGSHAGLGLALVKAYAAALDARATFDLPAPGLFRVDQVARRGMGRGVDRGSGNVDRCDRAAVEGRVSDLTSNRVTRTCLGRLPLPRLTGILPVTLERGRRHDFRGYGVLEHVLRECTASRCTEGVLAALGRVTRLETLSAPTLVKLPAETGEPAFTKARIERPFGQPRLPV